MEDWVTIRNLKKKNANLGTRAIAAMLGISRNVIMHQSIIEVSEK